MRAILGNQRGTKESALEYGRGIAGGMIFSLPLLYTSEVWSLGLVVSPARLASYFAVTFAILLVYNRLVGLRRDASMKEVAIDSVEEIGIGLVLASMILWLCGRFGDTAGPAEMLGMVVMEGMTVAIGVSVGTAQLGCDDGGDNGLAGEEKQSYLAEVAIAFCGAVLFAANVAPTDEVHEIAMESPPERLLILAGAGILLGVVILHFSGFRGTDRADMRDNWRVVLRGIATTYAVALVASWLSLHFFGQMDGAPLELHVAQVVVLGVPAVIGASAGRLLLQTRNSNR